MSDILSLDDVRAMIKSGDITQEEINANVAAFEASQKRKPKLDTDGILIAQGMMEGDDPAEFIKTVLALEEKAGKHELLPDKDMEALSVSVYSMAELLDKRIGVMDAAVKFIEAPEHLKQRCVDGLWQLQNDPDFDMDQLPRPGTIRKEGMNIPYDLYYRQANDGTEIEGSYFDDLAFRTTKGKAWSDEHARYFDALHEKEGADKALKSLPKHTLEGFVNQYATRLKNLGKFFRNIAKLYYVMCDVQDKLPAINLKWQTMNDPTQSDDDVKANGQRLVLVPTNYPFYIQDTTNPAKVEKKSMGDLFAFKPDLALEKLKDHNNNQYDALKGTAKKKKGKKGGKQEAASLTPEDKAPRLTVQEFIPALQRLANLLDYESEDGRAHQASIVIAAAKWSDDEVLTFKALYDALDNIEAKANLVARAEAIGMAKNAKAKGSK